MKRESLSAAQSSHPGANRGRAHRNRSRSDAPGSAELRAVLKELDRMVGELQRQVALDDGSDEARLAIAASRRDLAQRLEDVLKRIAPAIEASEYHVPGISEQFGEIWLDRPEIIQGARTWLGYAGRVRQVLIRALEDHPSGAPAGALTSAVTNGARTSAATTAVVPSEFLTTREAADLYNVSTATVRRRTQNLPEVLHVGGKPRTGDVLTRHHLRIPRALAERLFKPVL